MSQNQEQVRRTLDFQCVGMDEVNPNFDQIDYSKDDEEEEGSDDEQKELEISMRQLSIEEKNDIGLSTPVMRTKGPQSRGWLMMV